VTLAASDLDGAERWVSAADRLRAQQSLEEYWMGSLATAVAGQLAAGEGDLEQARERLERAVVLARRGAARPEHIYALAALAPVQATLADAEAAAATLRSARHALSGSPSPGMFPHLLNDVDRRLRGRATSQSRPTVEVEELSAREMSVLRLLGSELSIAGIGEELYISRNTVKTHVRGIYRKLDADTRAAAVARARALGLL
jgi:LuxR family maltose regulon positive regulatory protein